MYFRAHVRISQCTSVLGRIRFGTLTTVTGITVPRKWKTADDSTRPWNSIRSYTTLRGWGSTAWRRETRASTGPWRRTSTVRGWRPLIWTSRVATDSSRHRETYVNIPTLSCHAAALSGLTRRDGNLCCGFIADVSLTVKAKYLREYFYPIIWSCSAKITMIIIAIITIECSGLILVRTKLIARQTGTSIDSS